MFQKDFVLRQIQQLVQVMAHVLQLKREGRQVEAQTEIGNVLQETFAMGMKELLDLGQSELVALCSSNGKFNPDIALVLAELLEEEGVMSEEGVPAVANKCFLHALGLYKAMVASGEAVPIDVYDRIARLQ